MSLVLVNAYDMILVEGKPGNINTLRKEAKNSSLIPQTTQTFQKKELKIYLLLVHMKNQRRYFTTK